MKELFTLIIAVVALCVLSASCSKQETPDEEVTEKLKEIEETLKDHEEALTKYEGQWKEEADEEEKIEIVPGDSYTFSSGSTSSAGLSKLVKYIDAVVNYMRENPECLLGMIGHSDNEGTMEQNYERSKKQAAELAKSIIREGINKDRIILDGKGSMEPIASNETPEGSLQNRRVVFEIIASPDDLGKYIQKNNLKK